MSSQDYASVLRVPSRLVLSPTTNGLLGAYPHGGTALGHISELAIQDEEEFVPIMSEARARLIGAIRGPVKYRIAFKLDQYDPDVLRLAFRLTTTSPNGYTANTIRESTAGVITAGSPLLIAPIDLTHPGALIHGPIPFIPSGRKLEFSIRKRLSIPMGFWAADDANHNGIAVDRLENLSLT